MPDFHRIEELPPLAGRAVITRGWVMTMRSSGKIGFVMLRDGTGYLQVLLSKKDVPEAAWEAFGRLTQETPMEATAGVRAGARGPDRGALTPAALRIVAAGRDFPLRPVRYVTAYVAIARRPSLVRH